MSLAAPTDPRLRVSYSAINEWRKCQQAYWYRYVDGLRPRVESAAPELGRVLHTYLEHFYGGMPSRSPRTLHSAARYAVEERYGKDLQQLSWTARSLGQEDIAAELVRVVPTALILTDAYFRVQGESDAKAKRKVLLVEEHLEIEVTPSAVLPAVVDLVTQEADGRILLWEHKTTRNIPTHGRRFRDLQTILYAAALEQERAIRVDGIMWNYIRTAPPEPPTLLKRGELTRRADLITTRELYVAAIAEHGLKDADYIDTIKLVGERERTMMFQRFELPLAKQHEDILLRDVVLTTLEIDRARSDSAFVPVRTIDFRCDFCPMVKLCQAAIVGGDDADIRKRHFTTKKEKAHGTSRNRDEEESDLLALLD